VNKKQKLQKIIKSEVVFFIVLIFVIIGLFVVLSPKVSSILLPFKRQIVLNDFINKTKITRMINPQDYWKFREFYSPGFFTFSKEGIAKSISKNAEKEIGINYDEKAVNSAFLFFSSRWFNSLDMLTKQTDLNKIVDVQKIPKDNVIFIGKNCLIYKSGINTIKITFLLSDTDMQKVSGISDYQNNESIKGENWFNVTSLKTD
jgi:hypothetical protein